LPEQIFECETHQRPKNWYVSQLKQGLLSWRAPLRRASEESIRGFRRRDTYDWGAVRLSRVGIARIPSLDQKFQSLAEDWKREIRFASLSNQMFLIPSYQRIIGLGPGAIPLILRELQKEPNHWFWALAALTGENPADRAGAGNVQEMTHEWLKWGRERGYL
jgi:hypothetical protein